jgi:hypothetical protein
MEQILPQLMESTMENQPDRDTIVDEAVGQTHAVLPPKSVTEREHLSPEEAARRNAPAPGPQASMPEKTAASIGERDGGAYADPGSVQTQQGRAGQPVATKSGWNAMANCALSAGRDLAQNISDQFSDQRYIGLSLIAAFGLGFIAATMLRGSR